MNTSNPPLLSTPLTKERAEEIIKASSRCTQATLLAFGIDGWPQYASGTLAFFRKAGFKLINLGCEGRFTMKKLLLHLSTDKSYIIFTSSHVMAYRKGILVDTAGGSFDRRKVEFIWEVER